MIILGMDPVIYVDPIYIYREKDLTDRQVVYHELGRDSSGNTNLEKLITTPEGLLTQKGSYNQFTEWTTKYIIQNERDFEIWNKYMPIPERVDWSPVFEAKKGSASGVLSVVAISTSAKAAPGRVSVIFTIPNRRSWPVLINRTGIHQDQVVLDKKTGGHRKMLVAGLSWIRWRLAGALVRVR